MCKCVWLFGFVLALSAGIAASPILGADPATDTRTDINSYHAELEQRVTMIPEPPVLALMGLCLAAGVRRFRAPGYSMRRTPSSRRDQ